MINKAMDLVDDGVPENSPQIDKLEEQCQDKSVTRYEEHRIFCGACNATISAIGLDAFDAFLVAKKRYNNKAEVNKLIDSEANNAVASASRMTLDDFRDASDKGRRSTTADEEGISPVKGPIFKTHKGVGAFHNNSNVYSEETNISSDEEDFEKGKIDEDKIVRGDRLRAFAGLSEGTSQRKRKGREKPTG
jgi:hypothetical protein